MPHIRMICKYYSLWISVLWRVAEHIWCLWRNSSRNLCPSRSWHLGPRPWRSWPRPLLMPKLMPRGQKGPAEQSTPSCYCVFTPRVIITVWLGGAGSRQENQLCWVKPCVVVVTRQPTVSQQVALIRKKTKKSSSSLFCAHARDRGMIEVLHRQ